MDKNFCQQIDQESLVEQYVAGKLRGKLLDKFEHHLKECEAHAQAVLLEKALKRGVSEFARGEIKSKLRDRLKKREDTRFMILRYAAILLVAVITPLILYYQLNIAPVEMQESAKKSEQDFVKDNATKTIEDDEQEQELLESGIEEKKPESPAPEKKPLQPVAHVPASQGQSGENSKSPETEKSIKMKDSQLEERREIEKILKATETPPVTKIEADLPPAKSTTAEKASRGVSAFSTLSQNTLPSKIHTELSAKVIEDSLEIRKCIDSNLNETERESYKITLNIQVLKTGKIGEIKVIQSTHKSKDVEDCIFQIIKNWVLSEDVNDRQVIQEINY
jgi:hypothetical protein